MDKNEKKNKKILKQMSNEKNKLIKKEEKESSKIPFKEKVKQATHTAKDFFIKDTSKMILLIAIVIALYLVINLWVNSINLAQIDLTKNKLHTLTEQSKNIAKNINKEITFYVWGYSESSSIVDLLKQYNSANTKINYKIVNSDDVSTINEYGFETDYPALVGVSSDGRNSYISNYDRYTYDDSYNTIDLAEQKLTNAIVNLSVDKSTKVYFIEGRSAYSTSGGIYYLTQYLSEEFYEIDTLNIVSTPAIPEDCDILAIMGVKTDFTDAETEAICGYIEKGGDMIIANDIDYVNTDLALPNFQKILDKYAVSMPNKLVMDENTKNQVSGYNLVYQAEVSGSHEITRVLYNSRSVTPILVAPGMIVLDTEKMATNNVNATPILTTSTEAYVANLSGQKLEQSDTGYYVTAAAIQKTVESGEESRAVIFSTISSFSDNSLDGNVPIVAYNKDIILNSFAFAANQGELYSIRKTQNETPFVVTDEKDKIVKVIIYAIPISIATMGLYVWMSRRKLK